jgi:3-deoxy-D-manno-octulosonate 8-phosphate phosphatase (KDO 8-P phosphatase)
VTVSAEARARTPLERVRLLVLDVDGVMTDGRLYFDAQGEALKVFHVRDGLGLKQLMRSGVDIAVISGRRSEAVSVRCRELGIQHLEQGCADKVAVLDRLLARLRIAREDVLCVIDDTSDLALANAAGLSVAVADAHEEVRAAADRVTTLQGGRGAVREVCDWIIATRGAKR